MSHRRPSSLQPANDPYERGSYYAPSRNNIWSYASVRPWGSKVQQRRDCIESAKEQTSTDTLYLHGFMSNQLVRKLFAPSNPFSSIPWNSTRIITASPIIHVYGAAYMSRDTVNVCIRITRCTFQKESYAAREIWIRYCYSIGPIW